jgi:aspartyl aminopeptidase
MNLDAFNQALLGFLDTSPTPFHAAQSLASRLQQAGFVEVDEKQRWDLTEGRGYYLLRNDSSILAWRQPESFDAGLRLVGAHTDSPCLKVKPTPELHRQNYHQLGVEVYGGALLNPWFDRDLSLAGRVSYLDASVELQHQLIDFKRALGTVPSLAIHLDREANSGRSINAQLHLPVLLGQGDTKLDLRAMLAEQLRAEGTEVTEVLDYELSFYDTQPAALIGLQQEFLASARLDNLLSCFIGLQGLLDAEQGQAQVLICTDHEEIGSQSACGAAGPMLEQWLERVMPDNELRNRALAASMLISADNAHGVHPNYADKHDENHGPILNRGPVIKLNANQRYATNSETSAIFKQLAQQESLEVQAFVVRSDMGCGSTIGPITSAEVGVRTVDIGVPQFAMHSIRELAGVADAHALYRIIKRFYAKARV